MDDIGSRGGLDRSETECVYFLSLPWRETDVIALCPTAPPPPRVVPPPPPLLHTHPCLRLSSPLLITTASSLHSTISTVTLQDTRLPRPFGQSSPPRVLPSLRSAPLPVTGTNITERRMKQGGLSYFDKTVCILVSEETHCVITDICFGKPHFYDRLSLSSSLRSPHRGSTHSSRSKPSKSSRSYSRSSSRSRSRSRSVSRSRYFVRVF